MTTKRPNATADKPLSVAEAQRHVDFWRSCTRSHERAHELRPHDPTIRRRFDEALESLELAEARLIDAETHRRRTIPRVVR